MPVQAWIGILPIDASFIDPEWPESDLQSLNLPGRYRSYLLTVHYSRVRIPKANHGIGYIPPNRDLFEPRWAFPAGFFYVQDKVRPVTGREGALGYERYAAIVSVLHGS
jgi:hypothetical protein